MSTKKFLDSSGLAHFWDKAKEYIGDNTIPKVDNASGNLAQIDSSGNVVDSGVSKSRFALSEQGIPSGGTQNQVLAKDGSGNYNVSWKTPSYSDLDNSSKPKINGVSLDGNKDSSALGLASKEQGEKADTVFSNYLKAGASSGESSVTGFDPFADTVHNKAQSLSSAQQEQVRQNINAQQTIKNVVATSTEDASASFSGGTLILGLPKGADAVNPFKGWYDSSSNLPANPVVGDYAYVEDNGTTYVYRCITAGSWPSTSTEEKEPSDATFASTQLLNNVKIDDSHLKNPNSSDNTNDPVLPKALDVLQLKSKLDGVTREEVAQAVVDWHPDETTSGYYRNESNVPTWNTNSNYKSTRISIPEGCKSIRFLGCNNNNWTYNNNSFIPMYGFADSNGDIITSTFKNYYQDSIDGVSDVELTVSVPENAYYFICLYKCSLSSTVYITESKFYIYTQVGDTVIEAVHFKDGERLKQTIIDKTNLLNPDSNSLPTAVDAMKMSVMLKGISASDTKVIGTIDTNIFIGKYVSGDDGSLQTPQNNVQDYSYLEVSIPEGTKSIRFLTGTRPSGWGLGYATGYYDSVSGDFITKRRYRFTTSSTPNRVIEVTLTLEEGETVFRTTCSAHSTASMISLVNFYCYFQTGETVQEGIERVNNNFELFRQDYPRYEEVDMNKYTYRVSNYCMNFDGTTAYSAGWSHIKIPVSGYEKVTFLSIIRTQSAQNELQGYCFEYQNGDVVENSGHKYPIASNAGTEELTLDVPEGAYWFCTNSRYTGISSFTDNFFIRKIKGETLKEIVDAAELSCKDYTNANVDTINDAIDTINSSIEDINHSINISEGIEGIICGYGTLKWSNGWKMVNTVDDTNKRYIRLYDEDAGSVGIFVPQNTVITTPEGYTMRYVIYQVGEQIVEKTKELLLSEETLTITNDSYIYIELRKDDNSFLWIIPEGSTGHSNAQITEAGEYGFNTLISNISTNIGTLSEKIDEVDRRLSDEIKGLKNNVQLLIEPSINRTNVVNYHAALDYLCYDLDTNSENPKHPILLRSVPTYLEVDTTTGAVTPGVPNLNYPLYTYTMNMQLMYMLVDAHISQDASLGRAFPSTANSYQVYAPKTAKTYNSVAKPYKYYNDLHAIGAGNYKYNYKSKDPVENIPFNDKNNGIFYTDNWINNNKKKILIVSGIHGNEYGAPLALYEFIKRLVYDPSYADLLVNCEFTFIPIANPWGYNHNSRNRGATSINEDFDDYNGFTLQETQYIRDVLKQTKFDIVFDLHQHDLTDKNGLFGGFTSFNTAYFETPIQDPDTDTLVSAAVMNGEDNGTYTFTPIGRKIANAINEVCAKTDIAACRYAGLDYLQHSFLWINPRMGGTTLKKYASGERYTINSQPIGNARGENSGKPAYISMTCETPITNYWMNEGDAAKHNFYARCFANTYVNNLIVTMCRKLINGDFE